MIAELEDKRVVVACTTAETAEYVSNEIYNEYHLENLLNQSKIQIYLNNAGTTDPIQLTVVMFFQLQKMDHQKFSFVLMIIC